MNGATDYYYGRALRRVMATPQDVRAIAPTEDISLQYISAKAGEEEQAKSSEAGRQMGRERLKERGRQAGERFGLKKESLREARRQGKWATGISLANLALTGWGGYVKIKEAEKQTAFDRKREERLQKSLELQEKQNKMYEDFFSKNAGFNWHKFLRPSYSGLEAT